LLSKVLFVAYSSFHCSLFAIRFLLFAIRYSLFAICRSLFAILYFTNHDSLFHHPPVHCSPFTVHYEK